MADARRKSWWSPLGLALLCGHCALGALIAGASALGLATLPTIAGVPLAWVAPPALLFGGFGLWLWTGQRAAEADACRVPEPRRDDA